MIAFLLNNVEACLKFLCFQRDGEWWIFGSFKLTRDTIEYTQQVKDTRSKKQPHLFVTKFT